jgi:hypothetical protein
MATKKKAVSEVEEAPETEEAPKKKQVRILMSKDRMKKYCTVDEFIGLEERSIGAMKTVFARFVSNGKAGYVDYEEGLEMIGALTIGQLDELCDTFTDALKDTASPP